MEEQYNLRINEYERRNCLFHPLFCPERDKEAMEGFWQFWRCGSGRIPVIHSLLSTFRIWVYLYSDKFCDYPFLVYYNSGTDWHEKVLWRDGEDQASAAWSGQSNWIQSQVKSWWRHASAQHICPLYKVQDLSLATEPPKVVRSFPL